MPSPLSRDDTGGGGGNGLTNTGNGNAANNNNAGAGNAGAAGTTTTQAQATTTKAAVTTTKAAPITTKAAQTTTQAVKTTTTAPKVTTTPKATTKAAVTTTTTAKTTTPAVVATPTTMNFLATTTPGVVTPILPTTMSPILVPSLSTDGSGDVYTVTNVVSGASASDIPSSDSTTGTTTGFFANKGAVAAVFIIAGLAGTALVLFCCMNVMKKRRHARYEREALAHRNARNARSAGGNEKVESTLDDDPLYDAHGRPFSTSTAQMAQRSYPFAGARGSTATAPGVAGFGARALQGVHDPTPETTDYFSSDASAAAGNYHSGPQPQPAYESSHGHDQYDAGVYDTTAGYYGHAQPQYGQAYGDPAAYAGYNQQYQQGQGQGQQTTSKAWANSANAAIQRDLTPGKGRAKSMRKSAAGESVKSYYSDDEPVVEGNMRRDLRVANE